MQFTTKPNRRMYDKININFTANAKTPTSTTSTAITTTLYAINVTTDF